MWHFVSLQEKLAIANFFINRIFKLAYQSDSTCPLYLCIHLKLLGYFDLYMLRTHHPKMPCIIGTVIKDVAGYVTAVYPSLTVKPPTCSVNTRFATSNIFATLL